MAKKLVRGDYKHNRVRDPTAKLDSKHERTVKKFVKDYLDKAVQKKEARDKEKAAKAAKLKAEGKAPVVDSPDTPTVTKTPEDKEEDEDLGDLSADDDESPVSASGGDLKRKRGDAVDGAPSSPKKSKTEMPVPPPPPPPPAGDASMDGESVDSPKVLTPMNLETPPTSRSCESDNVDRNGMDHSKAPQLAMVNGES